MKTAMTYLLSLKEELENVQEAEKDLELEKMMTHVRALERILEDAKKPVCADLLSFYQLIQFRCSE